MRRWLLPLVALVWLLTGCRTDLEVVVDVEEDGSGQVAATVEFDREAAALVLDLGGEQGLKLDDLLQAGWEIVPPAAADDGSVRTTAIKRFGTPEQFAQIMAELSGEAGLFEGFELTREKAFSRVEYGMTGSVEPAGLAVFSDPALEEALGRTLAEIAAGYGAGGSDVQVSLQVRLPGTINAGESTGSIDLTAGDAAVRSWRTDLSADTGSEIQIASTTQEVAALVWRGVAIVAAALAVLVAFGHMLRLLRPELRRGRTAPKPRPRAQRSGDGREADVLAETVADQGVADDPVVIALDGMGVLYREGDDINRILVPFVREHGSAVTHDEIVAKARLISLGRITPSDFWQAVGVEGDPNELDDEYLARFQLNPGVVKFLRSLRDRGVRVACVTNDCTAWAHKLRVKHSLEGLIDPWVVSGAVGVRKPDKPIYEVLRRVTHEDPANIMVIDDSLENLHAARDFGFRTAWFAPEGTRDEAADHAILRSFAIAGATDEETPEPASS